MPLIYRNFYGISRKDYGDVSSRRFSLSNPNRGVSHATARAYLLLTTQPDLPLSKVSDGQAGFFMGLPDSPCKY
ncbi:hypothetical protein JTE90_011040 [Oedothorax gibbosus]|uniref:Uncharacterized protein n=1 Tax=Oedothorax gibbosus TaxID=931172 RepID=A0AAV6VCD8_9ARAC|nr:hypothetical protein JTE90_011040 [Oedothorax gibbosus]